MHDRPRLYESIDDVLGEASTRFFGTGFKHVVQRLGAARIDVANARATCTADVRYPPSWSKKTGGELAPHLSSIDGLVIAVQLAEAFIRVAHALDDDAIAQSWLRGCTLRAGTAPTLDLGMVPASLAFVRREVSADALHGGLSHFNVQVGTMVIQLVLDHPTPLTRDERVQIDDLEALLGPASGRYFGDAYRNTSIRARPLELEAAQLRARATVHIDYDDPSRAPRAGLAGAHAPFLSPIDAMVSVAQLAQAVMYDHDRITRAVSNNLWMRKIAISVPRPQFVARFPVETWITKSVIVPARDRRWRSASFGLKFPALQAEYSVAHELPARVESATW